MTRPLRLKQETVGRLARASEQVRAFQRFDKVDRATLCRVLRQAQDELIAVLVDIDFVLSAEPNE